MGIDLALWNVPNQHMLLTANMGVQINCDKRPGETPDQNIAEKGIVASINWIKEANLPLFTKPDRTLVDLGCGSAGTHYAHLIQSTFPETLVHWVDRADFLLKELNKPNHLKHCASIDSLPFKDQTFDIAIIKGVLNSGVSKHSSDFLPESKDPTGFEITKETARILNHEGILLINFGNGTQNPIETLSTLQEAGFNSISHIYRMIWFGMLTDLYAFGKHGV